MIDQVFYFQIDGLGNETKAFPITLGTTGAADLSALPETLRTTLETVGVMTTAGEHPFFPSDGQNFLEALLNTANPYFRFRTKPELHNITV